MSPFEQMYHAAVTGEDHHYPREVSMFYDCTELTCPHHGERNRQRFEELGLIESADPAERTAGVIEAAARRERQR